MYILKNKTALITGGTSGIGRAVAEDFIGQGAKVIITGRNRQILDETVKQLGPDAAGILSDNGKMEDILKLRGKVQAVLPVVDIIFANAGYGKFAPIDMMSEEIYDELFNVLVKGTYFTIKEMLPLMTKGGSIIVNSSVVTKYGSENSSVYSAAKAAVSAFTKNLAAEFIAKNIRINTVSPGYTETSIFDKTGMTGEQITTVKQYVNSILPLKRFATATEVAKAVSFLASDNASYIHGAEILVDGGYSVIR